MPRESSRAAPAPREPAAALRAPPVNGGMSAHRAASGSGYRGNSGEARSGGGNSGGSYRGGGGSERAAHPAARHTR
jgi:hypothetical protein